MGQPKDINLALSQLQYKCTQSDTTDTVQITVYDGSGKASGCMESDDLDDTNPSSDRSDGCLSASTTFIVEVGSFAAVAAADDGCEGWCLKLEVWLALVGVSFGLFCMCLTSCYYRVMKKISNRDDRGKAEDEDSDDQDTDGDDEEEGEEEDDEDEMEGDDETGSEQGGSCPPPTPTGKKKKQKQQKQQKKKQKRKKKERMKKGGGVEKPQTRASCCIHFCFWVPLRLLGQAFCMLMFCWCCGTCCPTRPKSKSEQEKEEDTIKAFGNSKKLRKSVELYLKKKICCLRCSKWAMIPSSRPADIFLIDFPLPTPIRLLCLLFFLYAVVSVQELLWSNILLLFCQDCSFIPGDDAPKKQENDGEASEENKEEPGTGEIRRRRGQW